MVRQVITIGPDGNVSGLQRKPNQGLDLRQFGKADIERASLIEWDTAAQAWYVNVLQEAGRGVVKVRDVVANNPHEWEDIESFAPSYRVRPNCFDAWEDPLLFGEYDDAVKVEIAYLDALRLKGEF